MSIINHFKQRVSKFVFELTAGAVVILMILALLSQFGYNFIASPCDTAGLAEKPDSLIDDTPLIHKLLYAAFLLQIVLGAFILWVLHAFLYQPLVKMGAVAKRLATGETPEVCDLSFLGKTGELANSLAEIIRIQSGVSAFAEEIGNSNYEGNYDFGEQHQLGAILLKMRNQLKSASIAHQRRSWANEGYGLFTDLLGEKHESMQEMASMLLAKLVKHIKINQGALFLLQKEGEENQEEYLELIAAYAWERKKYIKKKLDIREGLIGQVVLEADTIYMTDVPPDFINISSGLGKANPTCVLMVPLKYNEKVLGVLELAFFKKLESFQIEFVEKLAEKISFSLSNSLTAQHTQKLLQESQQMTEQLKRHEEELRNNSIELEATKEDLSRRLEETTQEMKLQIKEIKEEREKNIAILEGCVDGVITFDQTGEIEFLNTAAEEIWGIERHNMIGRSIKDIIPLELVEENGSIRANYCYEGEIKSIDIRTEVLIRNQLGEEVYVLLTLSNARVEGKAHFALFIQQMSVELF